MAELEELLDVGLEGERVAFLSVAVTGNRVREWQWYASDPNSGRPVRTVCGLLRGAKAGKAGDPSAGENGKAGASGVGDPCLS